MFSGPMALLARSLRIDARSRSTHLIRLALIGFAYFNFCMASASAELFSAPGLRYFSSLAHLDIFFISLFGIGYFSTTITEEKEEDTLGLLLMAGISPIGILAGKMGARFCQAASLLLIQIPLMLLCVTLGGITPEQIWAATISLLAFLSFVAGIGLFSSTIAKNSRQAAALVFLGLISYFSLIPFIWEVLFTDNTSEPPQLPTDHLTVFYRISRVLRSGFHESVWSAQVFFDFGVGFLFCVLSWLLFGVTSRAPSSESHSRGLVSRRRGRFRFPAGPVWDNPFAWKDFYFVSGGFGMVIVRVLFYLLAGFAITYPFSTSRGAGLYVWLGLCTFIWPLDLAINWARSMEQEVRLQTLASLVMLPQDTNKIIYSKLAGAALGSAPGLCLILLLSLMSLPQVFPSAEHVPEFILAIFVYGMFMMLAPAYAVTLALYLKWGSVAATVGLMMATYIVLMACAGMMAMSSVPPFGFIFAIGLGITLIHLFCHVQMLQRFRELAEK